MLNKRNNFLLASLLHFLTSFLNRTCMVHPKRKVMNIWVTISGQWKSSPFATRVRWRFNNFSFSFLCRQPTPIFSKFMFFTEKNPDTNLFFFLSKWITSAHVFSPKCLKWKITSSSSEGCLSIRLDRWNSKLWAVIV